MASSITTSGSMNTVNMRPAPDEAIDALWAQNLADNTGYAYYKETPLTDLSPSSTTQQTYVFTKQANRNGIKTLSRGLAAGAVTEYIRVYAEGADQAVLSGFAACGTLAYSRANLITQRFDLDISSLTNGNVYCAVFARDTSVNSFRPSSWLTYGSMSAY